MLCDPGNLHWTLHLDNIITIKRTPLVILYYINIQNVILKYHLVLPLLLNIPTK